MRFSAFEPCGGIIPIWRAKVIESVKASFDWINPSRTLSRSKPSSSIGLPVGARPPKWPGPANVPVSRHCTPQRLILGGRREDLHAQVGHRSDQFADELAHTLRREHVDLTAHVLATSDRPHRRGAVHVVRVDRFEVPPRERLGFARPPNACGAIAAWRTFAATSCTFVAASLVLSSSAIFLLPLAILLKIRLV